MPARRRASAKPGSSSSGGGTGRERRSDSELSATIRPSRRAGSIATDQWFSSRLLDTGDPSRQPHRLQRAAVVDAEDVGALADGEGGRRDRPPLTFARGQALLPGPREHGADEVLARKRDVERQAQRPQLAEPPQDLQVLVGAEVEVESGVDGDLLLGDAKLSRQLDSPLEPGPEVVDDVAVVTPGPVD